MMSQSQTTFVFSEMEEREREREREREKNGEEETDIGSQGEKGEGGVLREKEGEKEEGGRKKGSALFEVRWHTFVVNFRFIF